MDIGKGNWKRNLFLKAWERCRSLGSVSKKSARNICNSFTKSKSWHCTTRSIEGNNEKQKKNCQVAPDGCFSVYVGPEKQSEGPILLPCDVDLFYKVLAEMDSEEEMSIPSWSPLILCSPSHRSINKGYGAYRPFHRARLLKLNRL
ncbi:hypothetical protein GH714_024746 [Hevea brasiliensis]|uniref:Auxin-responsive protein n=1 Tax=Hevea brasiliensis TaxID=3981 RepID=A0A6A6MCW1_HEVBR|nr:hypothetical protein GH714_024746 [Hevea brasiliensis]